VSPDSLKSKPLCLDQRVAVGLSSNVLTDSKQVWQDRFPLLEPSSFGDP